MKKITCGLLIGALMLSMTACGSADEPTTATTNSTTENSTENTAENTTEVNDLSTTTAPTSEKTEETTDQTTEEATTEETNIADLTIYNGLWSDSISQRASIKADVEGDTVSVELNWGNSAFETSIWTFSGKHDASISENAVSYSNCKMVIRTYTDSDNYTDKVEYENGTGYITINKDGDLLWSDDNYKGSSDLVFKRAD